MSALVRYLVSDALRGQRWIAPVLAFLAAVGTLDASGGAVLPDYAATSVVLLPVTLWLTVVVNNSEDPIQADVTVVTAGGRARVMLAKLAVAFLGALVLALVALGWPLLTGSRASGPALAAGATAHLLTALAGAGLGALTSRPVIRRTGWAVLLGVSLSIAEVAVPHCPPAGQLLSLLDNPARHLTAAMLVLAGQTAALTMLAVLAAHRLARLRV